MGGFKLAKRFRFRALLGIRLRLAPGRPRARICRGGQLIAKNIREYRHGGREKTTAPPRSYGLLLRAFSLRFRFTGY
jgi:hypothetical protein